MTVELSTTCTTSTNGRTLRLTLHTTGEYKVKSSTDFTKSFEIDNLVKVRAKVGYNYDADKKKGYHIYYVATVVHELAKYATVVMVNVSCDKLQYADKWICSGKWTEWVHIGEQLGIIKNLSGCSTCFSIAEIRISVYEITTTHKYPELYEDTDLTDFTLSTQDGNVDVHKTCLAARSPVFKAMFTGTWKETQENIMVIKGYTRQTMQHLKDFLYLGTLPDDIDELHPLITLAAMYSIKDLKEECARKLAETVQPEDLYSLHELACENNIPELSFALAQLTLEEVVCRAQQIKVNEDDQTKND